MYILKLLPPHNTMFEKIIYRLNGVVNLTDLSRLPWVTANLNCAKHNALSKHMPPHFGSLMQTVVLPAYHCSAIISSSTTIFYVKPLLLNGIRYRFVQSNSR